MKQYFQKMIPENVEELLSETRCGLLVVDMQNDLLHDDGAYGRNGEDVSLCRSILSSILSLIYAARARNYPVFYTQNVTLPEGVSDSPAWAYFKSYSRPLIAGEYTIAGSWGSELVKELRDELCGPVIQKHRSDAFIGTDLDLLLRSSQVETLVVTGIVTNGCVEATLRHAAFLDYYTVLVKDACASTSLRMHQLTLEILAARHDLVATSEVLRFWGVK